MKIEALIRINIYSPQMSALVELVCRRVQVVLSTRAPFKTLCPKYIYRVNDCGLSDSPGVEFWLQICIGLCRSFPSLCGDPIQDQKLPTTAQPLWMHIIRPQRLLSYQGPNSESQLIRELCALNSIWESQTNPYYLPYRVMAFVNNSTKFCWALFKCWKRNIRNGGLTMYSSRHSNV